MQVSVEKVSDLSRKMTVRVLEESIQEKAETRLKTLAKDVKLDGFRPGKVPFHVVKKMFGERARGEVISALIESSYYEALQSEGLKPAGAPHIVPSEDQGNDDGFEYVADFEVLPEVDLAGIDQIEVKQPVCSVQEENIEKTIETLRLNKKEWNAVERSGQETDRLTFHFSGVCDDKNFTDGKVENYQLELGSNQMIPGFEDELLGLNAGQQKVFDSVFPEEYGNADLAGKTATFDVEVVLVEEMSLPVVNEEFIKSFGSTAGDVDSFKGEVKANLEIELGQAIKRHLKNQVMDSLFDKSPMNLPGVLVDQEIEALKQPYKENAKRQKQAISDSDLPREMFEEQAKRRVALGLLLSEIIQENEIQVDAARVRQEIEVMANTYEKPEDVVNWYYADKKRLADVERMILEEQVIDWVVKHNTVVEENVAFDELMTVQNSGVVNG
ncbi:MAG: trigger factor [Methylococcales bacterium]|jgi:trigger factor|nr:trigger factor [Methylococcales bacterium]